MSREYETISPQLDEIPLIREGWQEFSSALLIPSEPGLAIQTPLRSRDCFQADTILHGAGIDLRYHAAMPNLLVGSGLLLTFIGIALALQAASHIADPEMVDAMKRNAELAKLLHAASFKFITSIFGLLFSLVYALFRQRCLRAVENDLEIFISNLDRCIPLATATSLQQETNQLLIRQSENLESFGTDLAIAIGKELDSKFDNRLGEHIGPLSMAMQTLAQNLSKGTDDALEKLVNKFIESLQGHAGNGMDEVVNKLAGLASSLDTLQQGLNQAATLMTQSAEKMTERMRDGADETLKRMADQMAGLIENLRLLAEQTKTAGDDASRELANRITEACAGFETMARQVSTTLIEAITKMQTAMGAGAAESAARLSEQLTHMVGALREVADASRKSSETAFAEMGGQLSKAATAFQEAATKVAKSLETAGANSTETFSKSAATAVERIANATERMQMQLDAMLQELGKAIQKAAESASDNLTTSSHTAGESITGAGDALRARLEEFASMLRNAGEIAALALEEGGATARGHMESGGTVIGEQARGMASQIAGLGASADRLQGALNGFSSAATGASVPLQAAAQDLMAASSLAQETLRPLQIVGAQVRDGLEQLHGAATHLQDAHKASKDLAESLDLSARRFEGIDRDLAKTLTGLQSGLERFTEQVSTVVTATDENLSNAAKHLSSNIATLREALEEFSESLETVQAARTTATSTPRKS